MGVVLSLCGLRPEESLAQQKLPDTRQPEFPHLCVWSVQPYLVLYHHSGGPGAHCTKQGTDSSNLHDEKVQHLDVPY